MHRLPGLALVIAVTAAIWSLPVDAGDNGKSLKGGNRYLPVPKEDLINRLLPDGAVPFEFYAILLCKERDPGRWPAPRCPRDPRPCWQRWRCRASHRP